jgi:hypothetical protein
MTAMTRRDRHLLLGLAAMTLGLALAGIHGDVLLALPALLLALALLSGRYVGEERLARLAAAFVPARRRAATTSLPAHARRSPRALPRGGRLIAASLAVRPPPAALRPTA